jgi:hypothetical protein
MQCLGFGGISDFLELNSAASAENRFCNLSTMGLYEDWYSHRYIPGICFSYTHPLLSEIYP